MRRSLLLLTTLLVGSPAFAGHPYAGLDVGSAKVRPSDVDETVDFQTTPALPGDPSSEFTDDVFSARWDRTLDADVVAGYDFGWFRMEGELGHKRAPIDRIANDDVAEQFLTDLNQSLNRAGPEALTLDDFQQGGALKVRSAMVNGILDVKLVKRLNVHAGVGVGWTFLQGFDDHDNTGAWQRIVGARYSLTKRIDLGVKYRIFRTGVIKLVHDPVLFSGNPNQSGQTTSAAVSPDIEGQFRSKSVLLSLTYNLR